MSKKLIVDYIPLKYQEKQLMNLSKKMMVD